jgi:hypothetical protein
LNLEQLCRTVNENYHRLRDEKKALMFVRYHFELLAWKRQKLKLGAIVFEIKEIIYADIPLTQEIDIRFIRQDTSHSDELTLEYRLKELDWKWDFSNILTLIIFIILIGLLIAAYMYMWYCNNLESIAYNDPRHRDMIYYLFENTFGFFAISQFKHTLIFNVWIIETLTDFCINYNVIL